MRAIVPLLLTCLALPACNGSNENADEKADAVTSTTVGSYREVGPNERVGESLDRARAAAKAAEAQADIIRDAADAHADQLDRRADQLEDQADAIREEAEEAAGAVEDRAGQ